MKVALVYDRVNKFGGAERVLLALHEIWPEAPLYTSVYDKKLTSWANVFDVRTSFLQKLPLPKNAHEYYPFLMGIAFESFNFDEYDVVVSVTHEFAKAVITKPRTMCICYCLTPTGYLWSGHKQYFDEKPVWYKELSKPIVSYLRWYDKIVARRPDYYVAISRTVVDRVKRYYEQKATVIYPPVELASLARLARRRLASVDLGPQRSEDRKVPAKRGSYFLIVSRLVANKRIDIAVEAFNKLGLPLKIIGIGREEGRLKGIARKNIEFLRYLTDEEVASYYSSCRAVVIPGEEDFNLVAVEAQSFGKPVIAYGAGGVTETVIDGKTGWFFSEQTAESLIRKIREIGKIRGWGKIKPEDCQKNAARFGKEKFKKKFKEFVETEYEKYGRKFKTIS